MTDTTQPGGDNSAESERFLVPMPPAKDRHQGRCSHCTWSTSSSEDEAVHEAFRTHVCEAPANPFRSPWRVMGLLITGPLAFVLTAAAIHIASPAVFTHDYTDTGALIVETAVPAR